MGKWFLMVVLLSLLTGCGWTQVESGIPVAVYVLGGPDDRAALLEQTLFCPEGEDLQTFALNASIHGKEGRAPFPPGTAVTDFHLSEGVATVLLSEEAAALAGFSLTLARACVVLTLSGLDDIDGVILLIEGQSSEPIVLRSADFILGSLVLGDTERSILLFFADEMVESIVTETRILVVRETDTVDWYLRYMLEELIAGPRAPGLRPVLPEGTRLLSVFVEGGVCTVNFSGEFVSNADGGVSAGMTLRCLVRSVTAQPGVSAVRLLADGQPVESYGTVDTTQPLTARDVP